MRRFRIHHEKVERKSRIMLSLVIIIISVSLIANMKVTGFASQTSNQELLDIAMQSEYAKRFVSENSYRTEISVLDSAALAQRLSESDSYSDVPEGSYEVRFVSGNKIVTAVIYGGELFRTIIE